MLIDCGFIAAMPGIGGAGTFVGQHHHIPHFGHHSAPRAVLISPPVNDGCLFGGSGLLNGSVLAVESVRYPAVAESSTWTMLALAFFLLACLARLKKPLARKVISG